MQHILVDFNTLQQFADNEHVVIAHIDNPRDSAICLQEGEQVIVYDGEIQVEATVHRKENRWIGDIDWATRTDSLPLA